MSGIPWIQNAEAVSLSQFPGPIKPPAVGPSDTPVSLEISCIWLPYVAGACKALLAEAVWDTADLVELETTLNRVQDLLAIFEVAAQSEACSGSELAFACLYDFAIDNSAWGPQDHGPTSTPEFFSNGEDGFGFPAVHVTDTGVPGRVFSKAACTISFAETTLTEVLMSYDLSKGTFDHDDGVQTYIVVQHAGVNVVVYGVNSASDADGTFKSIGWVGSELADKVFLGVEAANHDGEGSDGAAVIASARLTGSGPSPCGAE
jgi:hypothetical protein